MRITVEMLKKAEACEHDIKLFEKEWPNGIPRITKKACLRAGELGFSLGWAACVFMSNKQRRAFRAAREKAYQAYHDNKEARHLAWDKFQKDVAIAFWRASL